MGASASPTIGKRQVSEGTLALVPARALLVITSVASARRIELGVNRNGNAWLARAATTAAPLRKSSNRFFAFVSFVSSSDAAIETACSNGFTNVTACEPLCPSVTNTRVGALGAEGALPMPETRHRHVPASALVADTSAKEHAAVGLPPGVAALRLVDAVSYTHLTLPTKA